MPSRILYNARYRRRRHRAYTSAAPPHALSITLTPSAPAFIPFALFSPVLTLTVQSTLSVGNLVFTGYAPTYSIGGNGTVTTTTGSLTFTGYTPTAFNSPPAGVLVGSLLFTGFAPSMINLPPPQQAVAPVTVPVSSTTIPTPNDLYLEWGNDLVLTSSASIQSVSGWDRARERIIRRMLTNPAQTLPDGSTTPPDYVFSPSFGIGGGALVSQNPTQAFVADLKKRIRAAVLIDVAVDPGYDPQIVIKQPTPNMLQVFVSARLLTGQIGQFSLVVG